ncbi:MAG TPA: metallophosphoesterase family protein [Dongiaceae bacterium]
MLIGLISDLHANLPALDAVLADMPAVDQLICVGDIVGYYAEPNEVCERLQSLDVLVIRGNHDAYVIGALEPSTERRAAYRTDWTRDEMTAANLAWLRSLPLEARLEIDGQIFLLRHANPWDEETYLYPDSARLAEISLAAGEILVVGHTHHPMRHIAGAGLIINPGSVGQPRDWNPLAAYATFDTQSRQVAFHRVSYDVARLQNELRSLGWDSAMIDILSRRKNGS